MEGPMSPSCSSTRSEYLTLCLGSFVISASFMMPIGSSLITYFKIIRCLSSISSSNSILLMSISILYEHGLMDYLITKS
jgi:uncharacterized membrane protein